MSSDNSAFVNPPSYQHLLINHLSNSTSDSSAFDSSATNNPGALNNVSNSGRPTSNSSGNLPASAEERQTSVRTQQLNTLNDKKNQMIRNNSTRSFGGRISGRNPLYAQSSLPNRYEFETPGQAVQLGNDQSPNRLPSNPLSSDAFINQTSNQLNGDHTYSSPAYEPNGLASQRNSYPSNLYNQANSLHPPPAPNNPSRPRLIYQPRSNDSDNTTSHEVRSEAQGSFREESVAEKFKSNYEKFLAISRSIDFEEKLINLQLNKSKLKASARTSALLAGFAMVAYVELSFDDNDDEVNALNDANNYNQANGSPGYNSVTIVPEFLIILFSLCTSLLVSVNILALMISTCLLPFIESISNSYNWLNDNDFQCLNYEFYELADNLRALSGKVSVLEAENGNDANPKICIIVDEYGQFGEEESKSEQPNDPKEEENNNLLAVQDKHPLTDQQIKKMDEDLKYLNITSRTPDLKLMNSSYRSLLSKTQSLELNRSTSSLNSNLRLNQPKSTYYSNLLANHQNKSNTKKQIKYDLRPLIRSSRRKSIREFTDKTISSRNKYLEEHLNNLKKHERINFFISISWKLSNVYGIFLFLIEIIILGWVKFWEIGFPSGLPGKKAAFASTLVILPFLFIFVWFIAYFYRNFIMVNFFSNFNLIRNINEFHNYKLVRTTSTGSLQSMV